MCCWRYILKAKLVVSDAWSRGRSHVSARESRVRQLVLNWRDYPISSLFRRRISYLFPLSKTGATFFWLVERKWAVSSRCRRVVSRRQGVWQPVQTAPNQIS